MWKPPCAESLIRSASVGVINGWARRLWQHSVDHRGVPERPGRVATILHHTHPDMRGEDDLTTAGMMYTIKDIAAILAELDVREKNGYTRTVVDVWDPARPEVKLGRAIMYYAKPGNDPAYVGPQSAGAVADIVATAVGPSGPNTDYVFHLEAWCADNGLHDSHVAEVAALTRLRLVR